MSSRSNRRVIAQQTLDILKSGQYTATDGTTIALGTDIKAALEASRFYNVDDAHTLYAERDLRLQGMQHETEISVFNETTLNAARRLASDEDLDVLCLNFASAKNPGGGFLNGSEAQEESLSRASAIYPTMLKWPEHFDYHRKNINTLYSDRMIYSPGVPVFRDDDDQLLEDPYLTSFITSPAVNRGAMERNQPDDLVKLEAVMFERINKVLAIAVANGHNCLVLGAWGCGVFRNDPKQIAELFARHLDVGGTYHNVFEKIAFAVLDRTGKKHGVDAFKDRFATAE
jgi:uncharacterized protein (TIGR02452 family)